MLVSEPSLEASRTALVEDLIGRFPHIPPEAVLKEDLLRSGMAFDHSALTDNLDGEVKPKSYFIFSFDQKPLAQLGEAAHPPPARGARAHRWPPRAAAHDRLGARQPRLALPRRRGTKAARCSSRWTAALMADVRLPPMPEYYRHELANGKTVMETAPTIQWGYLIYLTVLRLCQYFGAKEECQFCDINHNWRQHKQEGRPYTGIKSVDDVLEALAIIDRYDTDRRQQGLHAHRRLGHQQGRRAGRGRLLRPLRPGDRGALPRPLDRQGGRPGAAAAPTCSASRTTASRSTTPTTRCGTSGCSRSSAPARSATWAATSGTGASSTRPRCSAPRYVIPNFVAGVEMAKPFGFTTDRRGHREHHARGCDYFMSRGVTPRFTTWCPEPATPLGRDNPRARRWSTTSGCWRPTARRSRSTA